MRVMAGAVRTACVLSAAAMACCTAYSGRESPLDPSTSADASSDAASEADASGTPEGSTTEDGAGGGDADAGVPAGRLAAYGFDDGVSCAPWVLGPNTTAEIVGGGVTGGACRVCSEAVGGSRIYVSVDGAGTGTYRAAMRVKDETYAGAAQIEVRFQGEGGTTIGANATTQPDTTQWKDLAVSAPTSAGPSAVAIVLTAYSGPGCILVDDATLTLDP